MRFRFLINNPLSLMAFVAVLSCAPSGPVHTWLDFFVGRVEVLGGGGSPKAAEIRMPLMREDKVRTHEKSMAFVQCGADNIIQIMEDSELRMDALPVRMDSARSATLLRLLKGRAAFYTESLKEGGSFQVRMSSITCAVRGTLFSASVAGAKTVVSVREGSVGLKSDDGSFTEIMLPAGKKAEIAGKSVNVKPMDESDVTVFQNIEKVRPIAGMKCTPPEYIERYFMWRLDMRAKTRKNDHADDAGNVTENSTGASDGSRIAVTTLAANGVERSEAMDITRRLHDALSEVKGADRVVSRAGNDRRSANRILSGRVSRLGSTRIIAMSVADAGSGTVLFSKTLTMREGDDLAAGISGVAREIGARPSIWE